MTDTERSRAIEVILAELNGNYTIFHAAQVAWSMNLSVTTDNGNGIGYERLERAVDEARAQAQETGR